MVYELCTDFGSPIQNLRLNVQYDLCQVILWPKCATIAALNVCVQSWGDMSQRAIEMKCQW